MFVIQFWHFAAETPLKWYKFCCPLLKHYRWSRWVEKWVVHRWVLEVARSGMISNKSIVLFRFSKTFSHYGPDMVALLVVVVVWKVFTVLVTTHLLTQQYQFNNSRYQEIQHTNSEIKIQPQKVQIVKLSHNL